MQTTIIQCSVLGCCQKCSDQNVWEQAPIAEAPLPRSGAWSWFRPSFSAYEVHLCPTHSLILHALLSGHLSIDVTAKSTIGEQ